MDFWETLVNAKSLQRVSDKYTGHFRGLDLCLRERANKDGFRFEAKGSLHKCYNAGLHNADQFTFEKLETSIDGFCDVMGLAAKDCELHGLEVGININLPFVPVQVLKNLVSYGGKGFDLIDKKNAKVGLQCALVDYAVKVYDKGRQSKQDGNILRFEVSINKMRTVAKYGIDTLADLQQPEKVYPLITLLLEVLNRIVWTDSKTDLSKLGNREVKQWLYYSNAKSWQDMDKRRRFFHGRQWQILLNKYGNVYDLKQDVLRVWNELFQAQEIGLFHRLKQKSKHFGNWTFSPLVYTGKKSHETAINITTDIIKNNTNIYSAKNVQKADMKIKKVCASCGRDISHQKEKSRFCSALYVGAKLAKQCRNKESNNRLYKKRKIKRAMNNERFLQITYHDKDGRRFTDVLQPMELHLSRQWLDRIQEIKTIPKKPTDTPEALEGLKARKYLQSLLNNKTKANGNT